VRTSSPSPGSEVSGRFGPLRLDRGYRFRLYAPGASAVVLTVDGRTTPMQRDGAWFVADDDAAHDGSRYTFTIDGGLTVPDPGSRFQPDGVHGPSAIADAPFAWPDDGWTGRPWHEHVIYELHVGTFTFEGTYEAAIAKLDDLVALGVTAVELMPIAAFPGARNWGYDGVLHYAPYAGYGTPHDLKRFVAAAHARGLAVLIDVVYNHFGPEGNYLHAYAPPFFNEGVHTPWGAALDITVPEVRAYFIENAAYWLTAYRFDGLRLDATHAIADPHHPAFLHDLRAYARAAVGPERHIALVVENDDNDIALLDDGYDAQWNDDVHHCAHVLGTGEDGGYFQDYAADPAGMLGRALATGYAVQGEPSAHRGGKLRGSPSARLPLSAFVSFLQNHDQIGNRAFGERISRLTTPAVLHALTALVFLAPAPPLLFMGEEWAASTPFLYFCDFEPELARLVTEGRRREFGAFAAFDDPHVRETIPDPSAPQTFAASVLRWEERGEPEHAAMLAFVTRVLQTRQREVVPYVATITGTSAAYERVGERGLALRWAIPGGMLHADAQLGPASDAPFRAQLPGTTFFHTHGATYDDGRAPAWSVRWSRA
jgi:malto-oligosyltrehalose trehalohydrolase